MIPQKGTAEDPQAGGHPVFAVLLAGGKGTRFWPASRVARPKQFLALFGDRSLLRSTWDRFARIVPPERILVVTGRGYVDRVLCELPMLDRANLLVEPSGHDTAPAAGLAARVALDRDPDPLLVVAPTDHFIMDEVEFARVLAIGFEAARSDALVAFGIVPDRPATNYGYIEVAKDTMPAPGGASGADRGAVGPLQVRRFHEKPDVEKAAAYLATGRFFWNAGIFAWRARTFEAELASAAPQLLNGLASLPAPRAPGEAGFSEFEQAWEALASISIDYALMEKSGRVQVVPLAAGWSDVGGWDAVRERLPEDESGNRFAEDVLYVATRNCSVHRHDGDGARANERAGSAGGSASGGQRSVEPGGRVTGERPATRGAGRLYALVDVEGLIVVETDDAVLICREGSGELLREVVKRLRAAGREELL